MTARLVMLVAVLSPLLRVAGAQLIPVKTVPVADGDQYGFFPSANLAMGGVSIALADSLRDPFSNPAKASRLARGVFFGSPSFYALSRDGGSGSTLPVGAIARRGSSFGGLAVAIQEIKRPGSTRIFVGDPLALDLDASPTPIEGPDHDRNTNRYVFAMLGHALAAPRLSFAGSAFWSQLNASDGVADLYPSSLSVRELGDAIDLRFGVLKEWSGDQSLEAVVVHDRFAMTHRVRYKDFFWDPATLQPIPQQRVEQNFDRTHTTGLQLKYERPLADSGWRIGALLTGNRTTHPTIPQLGAMSLDRDPGESSAFDVGVGVSKSKGPATLGVDAIYEPIWSQSAIPGAIDRGRYRFSNMVLRSGVGRQFTLTSPGTSLLLQFGVQVRTIAYRLDHDDLSLGVTRDSWNEWTHSWGAAFHSRDFNFRYVWRMQSGTGRAGVPNTFDIGVLRPNNFDPFFSPAQLPLVLVPVRVTTHQLSISIPIQ